MLAAIASFPAEEDFLGVDEEGFLDVTRWDQVDLSDADQAEQDAVGAFDFRPIQAT